MRGAMNVKICAAGLCLAIIAATAIAVAPVEAQTRKKPYVYTTQTNPPVGRPRARVTVAPRSFLDAGTEVLPGDRKFTDYAFPSRPLFDAFERGDERRRTGRLAPVAPAGAVRSS
jgi:hypothetical protein